MNNRCYRVIFSKAKGMLVVVSEATRSQGKSSNASVGGSDNNISKVGSQTSYYGKYATISASILISLGLAMPTQTVAETKIVADKSAPSSQQATILNTASGKVQVNIQTPSAAGVSRNTFSQFDVDKDGAILNNSRTNTQTKLAGWVEGNPWLAKGSANVILNEVNSSNPSILNGYTEIAGQKADLVIANPAGIQVQGGGFINSNRTTLTTGNPNLNNEGGLTGFNIDKGNIKIDGDLDDRGSNYTQIISKTAQINSGIYSQNLDVITGENQVSYTEDPTNTKVTNINTSTNTNQQTGVAIDVSSLGGMYANRIRLIGTQKGMGVTNAGNVNAADTLKLDVDGNLVNSGTLGATNDTSIDVSNNQVNNSGTISSSKKTINIESDSLTNSGVINSYDKTTLDQNTAINNSGLISAGALDVDAKTLDNTGRIEQTGTGKLNLETDTLTNKEQAVIGQSLYEDQPEATTPTLDDAPTSATGGNIIVSGKPVDLTGGGNNNSDPQTQTPKPSPEPTPEPLPPVTADGSIKVDTLNNTGSSAIITANGVIDGKANQTTNTGKSSIAINGLVTDNSQTDNKVINNNSRIQLNQQIDWDLQTFSNTNGQITTKSTANITTGSDFNNTNGKLISQGDMTLNTAGDLTNTSGVIQGNNTDLTSNNLDNTDGVINATGTLDIDSNGDVINQDGSISSADDLTLETTNLSNTGQIYSGGNADIDATNNLTNTGLIGSKGNTIIDANSINNTGDNATLVAGMKADGSLTEEKADLIVTGQDSLTSSGNHIATGTIELTADKTDLTDSNTQAGTINFISESDISTAGANITATDTLTLQTKGNINNQGGSLTAEDLNISADSLDNTKGSISQTGTEDLELSLANGINNSEGTLQANADTLSIDTNELTNTKGTIIHSGSQAGETALTIDADKVDNTEGKVLSLAQQTWTVAQTVNNTKGTVQAASFDMNLGALNNTDGTVLAVNNEQEGTAANTLTVTNTLNNTRGNINTGEASLSVQSGLLNNTKGNLKTADTLTVNAADINNTEGTISANNTNITTSNNELINAGGTVFATDSLTVTDTNIDNTDGIIQANKSLAIEGKQQQLINDNTAQKGIISQGDLKIDVQSISNNTGFIGASNQATLDANNINNTSGQIISEADITASAKELNNTSGTIGARGNIELDIDDNLNNQSGVIDGKTELTIITDNQLNNQQGLISSAGSLSITDEQETRRLNIDNKDGTIIATTTNTIEANEVSGDGELLSYQDLSLDTVADFTQENTLQANGQLTVNTQGDFINKAGVESGDAISINAKGDVDNQSSIKAPNRVDISTTNLNNQADALISSYETSVTATNEINNKGNLEALASLNTNSQTLNNSGKLIANPDAGNLEVNTEGTTVNTGLINAGNVIIKSNELLNSEKIFGGNIAIETETLVNGKDKTAALQQIDGGNNTSGSIASRGDLILTGGTLLNEEGALLYSQNNFYLGKSLDENNQATGKAGSLTNASAKINIMGDASLNATVVSNENRYLETDTQVTEGTEEFLIFRRPNDSRRYTADQIAEEFTADEIRLWRTWNIKKDPSDYSYADADKGLTFFDAIDGTKTFKARWGVEFAEGDLNRSHYRKWFTEIEYKTIVTNSAPGSIQVGGTLTFSDTLNNTDSEIIVGGKITSESGQDVNNESTEGTLVKERNGRQQDYKIVRDDNGTFGSSRWESRRNTSDYNETLTSTFNLDTSTVIENAANDISAQAVEKTDTQNASVDGVNSDIADALAESYATKTATDGSTTNLDAESIEASTLNTQTVEVDNVDAKSYVANTNQTVKLPNNSLYAINPDSGAGYLVETDESFTNYKKWLSSDYMLQQLELDPSEIHKRLGDGYYEQRLIQDQISQLTGRRFLEDYRSDEAQYRGLMDNGLTFAQKFNLRPGVALTEAQVAQLTSDIVWLVNKEVTLPDGTVETVLVPQVYLQPSQNLELRKDGSLMSADQGFDVTIKGDFNNVNGAVQGSKVMSINAENINNIAGSLESDIIVLETVQDINNIGGQVTAKDLLSAHAGGDINNETTLSENKGDTTNSTQIDRIAGFYVDGDAAGILDLKADEDINLIGSVVENKSQGGKTSVGAGNDINMKVVTTSYSNSLYVDKDNYSKLTSTTDVGSQIISDGDIGVTSGNDIIGTAATIESKNGDAIVEAENDIRFKEGRAQTRVESSQTWENEKWYGDEDNKARNTTYTDKAVTSDIIGDNVKVDSKKGDVELIGTDVEAEEAAQVTAMDGKVTVESAVEQNYQSYDHSTDTFYEATGHQKGQDNENLNRTGIKGARVYVNGEWIAVNAADLAATDGKLQIGDATFALDENGKLILDENGKPLVLAGNAEKVEFGTIDLKVKDWDDRQQEYKGVAKAAAQVAGVVSGALGVGDGIEISKSSTSGDSDTLTEKTQLSGNQIVAGGETVTGEATHFVTKEKGGTAYVLGDHVDFDVGTTTKTEQRATQEEVITGDGMRVKKDSLQLFSVTNTDSTTGTSKTTTTHEGVVFDSDNIVVVANDTLDAISTKFNGDTKDGNLLLGADIINVGGVEDTVSITDMTDIEELTVSAEVRHLAVDAVSAAEQVKEATSALAAAKNDLADAKERVARGELAPSALKDYEANLAAAGVNLANANLKFGELTLAALEAGYTGGFSGSLTGERTDTKTTDTVTQGKWNGSEFNVANITVVGDKFSSQGAKFHEDSIITLGVNDATLSLGTNTTTTSGSSKTNTQNANISTTGSYGGGAGYESSSYGSTRVTHSNGEMKVAEMNGNLDSLTLDGVLVKPTRGDLEIDELTINALQDTYNSTNDSEGANASISLGGSKPTGSIGGHKGSGYTDSAMVKQPAGIIFEDKDHKLRVGDTYNHGGTIAYIDTDADGNQTSGKLNYITDTYEGTDVVDRSTSDNSSFGGQFGTGSVGFQLSHTGYEKEVINHDTVGEGAIVLDDARTGKDSFADTNRDVLNTRTVVKDRQTAALDVDASIDSRVFTDEGRKQIIEEQTNIDENVRQTVENIVIKMPDGEYKDKALQTLNNIEAKLEEIPPEFEEVGGDLLTAYPEFIKAGYNPEDFETMINNPEVLGELQELKETYVEYQDLLSQEKQRITKQYIADGFDEAEANKLAEEEMVDNGYLLQGFNTPNEIQSSEQTNSDTLKSPTSEVTEDTSTDNANQEVEGPYAELDTIYITASQSPSNLVPNASSEEAVVNGQTVGVTNDSNYAISILGNVGEVKRKIDNIIAMTGINPEAAEKAITLATQGPVGVVKDVVVEQTFGKQIGQATDSLANVVVGLAHNSDYETVADVTGGNAGNRTADQMQDSYQLSKDGAEVVVGTIIGGGIGLGAGGAKKASDSQSNVDNDNWLIDDNATSTGHGVHYNEHSTAIGDDNATINNFNNVNNSNDGHNVIVHGSLKFEDIGGIPVLNSEVTVKTKTYLPNEPNATVIQGGRETKTQTIPISVEQVAEAVRMNPNYVEGTPVCFGSCWSGSSGTAQQLANELDVPVYAPTRPVAWDSVNNRWIQQPNIQSNPYAPLPNNPNIDPEWKMFYPNK